MSNPPPPKLSVVILTWNEEANIGACLASLAQQTHRDFEVLVLDAASRDRTAAIVRDLQAGFPVPLRLDVAPRRTSVGEGRNLGVQLAKAPAIAFLSADAEAEPDWVARALDALERADVAYGRQVHAPLRGGVGAAVRGLRYHHFPRDRAPDPAGLASHVNAVLRREILERFPCGTTVGASALDDMLLAKRAQAAGYRLAYEPRMVVRHHDVDSARAELRKNLREGLGWGEHRDELGTNWPVLAWCGLLAGVALLPLTGLADGPFAVATVAAALWLPAGRRAFHRRRAMPLRQLAAGAFASPPFDLAFVLAYARGLLARRGPSMSKLPEDAHER